MKIDYDTQIKQVRSGWVGAFGNMKSAFKDVFTNLRVLIDRLEIDNRRAVTTVPGASSGGPPHDIDLTGIHDNIYRLQDRMDKMQENMLNFRNDSPEVINYQNLGFQNLEEATSWIEQNCPHRKMVSLWIST